MWSMRYGLHWLYNKHLHKRIEEHKSLPSSVGRHMKTKDDLVHEMLLIRERQSSLNKQSDAKVLTRAVLTQEVRLYF